MSLAQITEKIRSDAQREADEVLAKARAKAELTAQRAEEEIDSIKSGFIRRFEVERPEIFRRREIVANLDVKKMMLQSSRNLIQDVYDLSLEKMRMMDRDDYVKLCEALLKCAISTKKEEIQITGKEKYLDQAWLDGFNQENGTELVFSENKPDIAGGFILTRGKIGTNCSWDMLIQIAQEKQESDVVKRLFPPAAE
ncbi:MAG: hypothetical protein GX672_03120 [Synergistaceae bacterium]|nr:hypothetical protein [Synergistaceae bacterium]